MSYCPHCAQPLMEERGELGLQRCCRECGGRLVTLAILRKGIQQQAVNEVWQQALAGHGVAGRPCPDCGHRMLEVHSTAAQPPLQVDACLRCTQIWFDATEYQSMPQLPPPVPEPELPAKAREAVALAQVEAIGSRRGIDEDVSRIMVFFKILRCLLHLFHP